MAEQNSKSNVQPGSWTGWGEYMSVKRSKLSSQFRKEAETVGSGSEIFKGVSIYVNGYTDPTADVLKRIVLSHGGQYHTYDSSKVTHTIASNLALTKIQKLSAKDKVMCASWITDSLKAGRLLPEKDYYLYSAVDAKQPKLTAVSKISPTTDPGFLKEFYARSRLHFISTLAEELKNKVRQLKQKVEDKSAMRCQMLQWISENRPSTSSTVFDEHGSFTVHMDIDCFFVSVSLQNAPHLCDQPVVVAHSTGVRRTRENSASWSEIASCNYVARKYGIKNGMLLGRALQLCPNLHSLQYDFERCRQVSHQFFSIISNYTDNIEAISCDEMYINLRELCSSIGVIAMDAVTYLRHEVQKAINCTISAGIGPNKLVARLATKKAKPDGQLLVNADQVDAFMQHIDVADLPGVGSSALAKLTELDVKTCDDLRRVDMAALRKSFGLKTAQSLYNKAHGIDDTPVETAPCRKSLSCDVNYGVRLKNNIETLEFLAKLSGELAARMTASGVKGRTFTLKLMIRAADAAVETVKFLGHGICDYTSKAATLPDYTNDEATICRTVTSLFHSVRCTPTDIRGIGLSVHRLKVERRESPKNSVLESFLNSSVPAGQTSNTDARSKPAAVLSDCSQMDCSLLIPERSEIDMNVLRSLPESVRNVILKKMERDAESKMHNSTGDTNKEAAKIFSGGNAQKDVVSTSMSSTTRQTSQPVEKPTNQLPSGVMKTLKERGRSRSEQSEVFQELNIDEIENSKAIITSWATANRMPAPNEVFQIASYIVRLVETKYLHQAQLLIAYVMDAVCAKPNLKICADEIIDVVQEMVIHTYGCPLQLERKQ